MTPFRLPLLAAILCLLLPITGHAEPQVLDRIVAVVNNNAITQSQLTHRVMKLRKSMATHNQPLPPADILKNRVLQHMIMTRIQLQLAQRGGIKIDNTTLNDSIKRIANHNKMTLAQFADKIRSEGTSWTDFRDEIRRQLTLTRLQRAQVGKMVHVTDQEINQFLQSAEAKKLFSYDLHLAHIFLRIPNRANEEQRDTAQKQAASIEKQLKNGANFKQLAIRYSDASDALKGGDLGWKPASALPTLFTKVADQLSPGDTSNPLTAGNGLHIIKLIDRRGNGSNQIITQYKVRHILIDSNKLRTPEQAEALAKRLHQKILDGASFATIAKEYSTDPGSASKGGDLGWVNPGQMVPAFEDMMKQTQVGKLSPVFQTQFGWHILQVEATRQTNMSEQYRHRQARRALHDRYYQEQLQLWMQKIRSEAYVDVRL